MTLGFLSGSRNNCKLLWVSCAVLVLHGYALDPLSGYVLQHDCISVIVSRFAIVTEDLVICCYHITKFFRTSSPLRLLHGNLVTLVLWQIAIFVFGEMKKNTVLTQILTSLEYALQRNFLRNWRESLVDWNFIILQMFPEFLQPFRGLRIQQVIPVDRGCNRLP